VNFNAKDLVGSMEWRSVRARKSTALSTEMFVAMCRMQIFFQRLNVVLVSSCEKVREHFIQLVHIARIQVAKEHFKDVAIDVLNVDDVVLVFFGASA
jgi:hypothetical protein